MPPLQLNESLLTDNVSVCEAGFLFGCSMVILSLTFCPPIVVEQEIVNDLVLVKLELGPRLESVLDVDESVPLHVPLVPMPVTVLIVAAVASYVYDASFTLYVYWQVADTAHDVFTLDVTPTLNELSARYTLFKVMSPSLTSWLSE